MNVVLNHKIWKGKPVNSSKFRTEKTEKKNIERPEISKPKAKMRIETERAKNLMCLLRDPEGNSLEAAMYFPLHARPQQLSQTVNELLSNVNEVLHFAI